MMVAARLVEMNSVKQSNIDAIIATEGGFLLETG